MRTLEEKSITYERQFLPPDGEIGSRFKPLVGDNVLVASLAPSSTAPHHHSLVDSARLLYPYTTELLRRRL